MEYPNWKKPASTKSMQVSQVGMLEASGDTLIFNVIWRHEHMLIGWIEVIMGKLSSTQPIIPITTAVTGNGYQRVQTGRWQQHEYMSIASGLKFVQFQETIMLLSHEGTFTKMLSSKGDKEVPVLYEQLRYPGPLTLLLLYEKQVNRFIHRTQLHFPSQESVEWIR